jgi:TRAP transporter TAXI family solute receptor
MRLARFIPATHPSHRGYAGFKDRLLAVATVALALCTAGCTPDYQVHRLRITTGHPEGVYRQLGTTLAGAWSAQLGIEVPEVQRSVGSQQNLDRLRAGESDVAIAAADVAADDAQKPKQERHPMALARIHDDYLHVVVSDSAPITTLADLRGRRVSIGSEDSGVEVIATRLLRAAGLNTAQPGGDLTTVQYDLKDSLTALRAKDIDAFFWSGGLPTGTIQTAFETAAREHRPMRMLDVGYVTPALRKQYPIYGSASIPASTYNLPGGPVTTLVVPNFLLATNQLADEVAEALTRGLFEAYDDVVQDSEAARSIDIRSAIETAPVPLHPGAIQFYRENKI